MKTPEVDETARRLTRAAVVGSLRLSMALQVAALEAMTAGFDAAAWTAAADEAFKAVGKAWSFREARLAEVFAGGPAPDLVLLVDQARDALISHVDSCPACHAGVLAHEHSCGGCTPDGVVGSHVVGAGGCPVYGGLQEAYDRAMAVSLGALTPPAS